MTTATETQAEKQKAIDTAEHLRQQDEERVRAEAKGQKAAEQARLAAPDKDKLHVLLIAICAMPMPSVSSEIALDAVQHARMSLNDVVKHLREAVKEIENQPERKP